MEAGMEDVFTAIAVIFEAIGVLAMVAGLVLALALGFRSLRRSEGGQAAFQTVRGTLGGAIMLGLEVLIAADLVRTITSKPSISEAVVLGLIVLIRTVLSLSISVEIEGVLPWRRAAATSGATVVARQIQNDRRSSQGETVTPSNS